MTEHWRPRGTTAEAILSECVAHFGERAAMSCSFGGPGGMVLLHMLSRLGLSMPVIFLDTDFLFPETLALRDTIVKRFGVEVLTYRPAYTPEEQAALYGDRLWATDPDGCCRLRKVEPMQRAIEELDLAAWVTALRRDQSATRRGIDIVERQTLPSGRALTKVYPLAGWTRKDVWTYIHQHGVPYNPLLDQGYTSLGCTHCTVVGSGDERSGRWPGRNKTECGLHTFEASNG